MPETVILLAVAAGTGLGLGTGLVPGLHPNTLAALVVAVAWPAPGPAAVLLVAAATSHTFLNVVPALALGVGDPDSVLASLPGHDMIRDGAGEDAVLHSAAGSLVGLLAALAVVPLVPLLAGAPGLPTRPVLAVALAGLTAFLILQETGPVPVHRTLVPCFDGVVEPGDEPVGLGRVSEPDVRAAGRVRRVDGPVFELATPDGGLRVEDVRGWADDPGPGDEVVVYGDVARRAGPASPWVAPAAAAAVFLAAALLGRLARDLPLVGALGPASPLLPLLSGLFGGATLLLAGDAGSIPDQLPGVPPPDRSAARWGLLGVVGGVLVAALPGVTAAQGTAIASVGRPDDPKAWVTTISAVNTSAAVLGIAVLVAFARVRSGIAAALTRLPSPPAPGVLFASMLVAGAVAFPVTAWVGRRVVARADRLADPATARWVLVGIAALVAVLSGPWGLVLFAVASALGTIPPRLGVRRIHLMGALLGPLLWSLWTG